MGEKFRPNKVHVCNACTYVANKITMFWETEFITSKVLEKVQEFFYQKKVTNPEHIVEG